jgi:hypothetical protein
VATVASSCLSPTLPLPPPTVDSATAGANGLWDISGTCEPAALVVGTNQANGAVSGTTCTKAGFYSFGISGKLCETVIVLQIQLLGDEPSTNTSFVLEPTANGEPLNPNDCQ